MKIYVAEFRPRDLNKTPLLWKLVLEVIGTGYYHTGIVIGNRYFEMYDKGYRYSPFDSFEELNNTRGKLEANENNAGDSIDFVMVPHNFTPLECFNLICWWEKNIENHGKYGFIRFAELVFAKTFRKLSEWYYDKTGKVLLFAKTEAERSVRVCSSAVDESLRSVGVNLFPKEDETITVPGLFANKFGVCYRGS